MSEVDTTQESVLEEVDISKDLICEDLVGCDNKAEWLAISINDRWRDGQRGPLLKCDPCKESWVRVHGASHGHQVRFVRL